MDDLSTIETQQPPAVPNPPLKWRRVLAALLTGRSFNRFEAERELHDHALPSTVSRLERMGGIIIDRTLETVPGFAGTVAHVMRYRLNPASFDAARALMGIDKSAAVST